MWPLLMLRQRDQRALVRIIADFANSRKNLWSAQRGMRLFMLWSAMNQMCSGSCSADWTLKLAFCRVFFLNSHQETLLPLLLRLFFVISVFLLRPFPPPKKKEKRSSVQSMESALLVMHMNSKNTHGLDHQKRPRTCVGCLFLSTIWASRGATCANGSLHKLEEAKHTWAAARRHHVTC